MNLTSIALAALAGTVTYFLVGGILLAILPNDGGKPPAALFRPHDQMMKYFPFVIVTMGLCISVAVVIFAKLHPAGAPAIAGAKYGLAIGAFVVFGHVGHDFATFNIGPKLAATMAGSHFVQWVLVCTAIALVYGP